MNVEAVAFYLLSGIVLASGLAVVRASNLFHAGLSLIVCFVGVAGLYINLDAPFLGAMQVLVYAGAIAVLLLFGFMLTHDLMRPRAERFQGVAGALVSIVLAGLLSATAVNSSWAQPSGKPVEFGVEALAQGYMTRYLVPFEVVAIMLLAALIGAVVIARKEEGSRD